MTDMRLVTDAELDLYTGFKRVWAEPDGADPLIADLLYTRNELLEVLERCVQAEADLPSQREALFRARNLVDELRGRS